MSHRLIDSVRGLAGPVNSGVRRSTSLLTCPTEPARCGGAVLGGRTRHLFHAGARQDQLRGCQHEVEAPIDVENHGGFYLNSRVRVVDVVDGMSQTIFVGEVAVRLSPGLAGGDAATLRNTGHPSTVSICRAWADRAREAASARRPDRREIWKRGSSRAAQAVSPRFVGGFGSAHPGGREPTSPSATARCGSSSRRSICRSTSGWAIAPMAR